jgi:hypothetical protein
MSQTNGMTVTANTTVEDSTDRYRPQADTAKVYDEIIESLGRIVNEALRNGSGFVSLAVYDDRDESTAIRVGHLVEATECLKIATRNLDELSAFLACRMRTEDERNGPAPF